MLLYKIPRSFNMIVADRTLHIPSGTVTVAYYWEERPYNVYHWRTPDGTYLGSYFNIVKETSIAKSGVSYTDMIIDVMVMPDGSYTVLDEEELPEPLNVFEKGFVKRSLEQLLADLDRLVHYLRNETDRLIAEGKIEEIA